MPEKVPLYVSASNLFAVRGSGNTEVIVRDKNPVKTNSIVLENLSFRDASGRKTIGDMQGGK